MDIHSEIPAVSRTDLFAKLRKLPFVRYTDIFFQSKMHFMLIGLLTVLSNIFGLELPVYCCIIAMAIYIAFFGKDFLPLIPLVGCGYITVSRHNNPGINPNSIFYPQNSGLFIFALLCLLAIAMVIRLCFDPEIGQKAFLTAKRKQLGGILLLCASYMLAGAFSGSYTRSNMLFAFLQAMSVFLPYYLFSGSIKWQEAPNRYFAWTGICLGFSLVVEIIAIYITVNPIVNNAINRNLIYTGWGNYNNIGAYLVLMIPFAFQLGTVKKRSWLYSLCGSLFLVGVLLTCSRTSILVGVLTFFLSMMALFVHSRHRRICVQTNLIVFGTLLALVLIFYYDVFISYLKIFTIERSISSRFAGFSEGFQQFLKYPVFGGSFYAKDYLLEEWSTVVTFTSRFPARWHNTLIQMGASCGTVGLLAYGYHRYRTIRLFAAKRTIENTFTGISIFALLLMSLFDCHFFNIAPTLFYSMALAFSEKHSTEKEIPRHFHEVHHALR